MSTFYDFLRVKADKTRVVEPQKKEPEVIHPRLIAKPGYISPENARQVYDLIEGMYLGSSTKNVGNFFKLWGDGAWKTWKNNPGWNLGKIGLGTVAASNAANRREPLWNLIKGVLGFKDIPPEETAVPFQPKAQVGDDGNIYFQQDRTKYDYVPATDTATWDELTPPNKGTVLRKRGDTVDYRIDIKNIQKLHKLLEEQSKRNSIKPMPDTIPVKSDSAEWVPIWKNTPPRVSVVTGYPYFG